ncbi:hypothetical protein HTT03_09355 [Sulfitobacter sp. S0837]|uniref:hypothetical protein n=1 Tax=Sulfitobacter maritimus TaxID=2741719 RepID=UPI001581E01F|nr:hypothetical protein [Sulfitobacter maritimus]NUH65491.1 hypothetical protein [Sulfitobacter maritimus]
MSVIHSVVVKSDLIDDAEFFADEDGDIDLDCNLGVNVHVTITDVACLYVEFTSEFYGTSFKLNKPEMLLVQQALASGTRTDAFLAQIALIEGIWGWYEDCWSLGLTHEVICALERRRLNIGSSALFWEEPSCAGYGSDLSKIIIYAAGDRELMVCHESESCPYEDEPSYGFITQAQYDAVEFDPYDYQKMASSFAKLAGLTP